MKSRDKTVSSPRREKARSRSSKSVRRARSRNRSEMVKLSRGWSKVEKKGLSRKDEKKKNRKEVGVEIRSRSELRIKKQCRSSVIKESLSSKSIRREGRRSSSSEIQEKISWVKKEKKKSLLVREGIRRGGTPFPRRGDEHSERDIIKARSKTESRVNTEYLMGIKRRKSRSRCKQGINVRSRISSSEHEEERKIKSKKNRKRSTSINKKCKRIKLKKCSARSERKEGDYFDDIIQEIQRNKEETSMMLRGVKCEVKNNSSESRSSSSSGEDVKEDFNQNYVKIKMEEDFIKRMRRNLTSCSASVDLKVRVLKIEVIESSSDDEVMETECFAMFSSDEVPENEDDLEEIEWRLKLCLEQLKKESVAAEDFEENNVAIQELHETKVSKDEFEENDNLGNNDPKESKETDVQKKHPKRVLKKSLKMKSKKL